MQVAFDGALWSGPPFRSATWRTVTQRRDPDSPAWLPEFREGEVVRFMNQYSDLSNAEAPWGPFRIAFLQYASDPITFFSPSIFYRRPDWLRPPRGPDVSPELRWYPVVTGLQLAADIAAGGVPPGYGHSYAVGDYVDAWRGLTGPRGWDAQGIARLKAHLKRQQLTEQVQ
ncbi:alpha/beta-hydrolase family protein [Ectothiorhodospira mobilis]|uniref:alpha/beta-hydrolase family protein n=1 Tax=Ectothiorhodospira mobilis TaxID=195064 RepID=UPI003140089B